MLKSEEQTFITWLYRPYIDLTPEAPQGNIWTTGLVLAIDAFENETNGIRLHGVQPEQYRQQIIREALLPQFQVSDPKELPDHLRTWQWASLVSTLNHSPRDPAQFVRALWVLSRMCLHDAVIAYSAPRYPEQMERNPLFAEQMLMRGISQISLADNPDTLDLEWVANETALGERPAIEATYFLAAAEAKGTSPDLGDLGYWVSEHHKQISAADAEPHDRAKWWSRYYRVQAFIPQFEKDKKGVTFALNRAQMFADEMRDGVEKQTLQMALAETRTEEALMLGDTALALERANRYVELNPLNPEAYLKLGKVLATGAEHASAAKAYLKAAQYCPPKTEIVKFSLGYCYEQLGMLTEAQDAYLDALNSDPEGYSSLEQLIEVAGRLKNHVLKDWAKQRLDDLEIVPDEPKPYQLTTHG